MKLAYAIPLVLTGIFVLFPQAYAELIPNDSFLTEGSGFAVTEKEIKNSEIDMLFSTTNQVGSRIPFEVIDGFITLDQNDFIINNMKGEVLRDGRYIRISGTADNVLGEISVSLFGRLIEDSDEGSIFSFTGRISEGIISNKIVYTAKISQLLTAGISTTESTTEVSNATVSTLPTTEFKKEFTFTIVPGASSQSLNLNYQSAAGITSQYSGAQVGLTKARYVVPTDRLIVVPGYTLYFENLDSVPHTIVSAKRDTNSRGGGTPIPDGRLSTGVIEPGETGSITVDLLGFIFLTDPQYTWIKLDITSFPEDDDTILIRSTKQRSEINFGSPEGYDARLKSGEIRQSSP